MSGMNTAPYQDFAREKLGFEFNNLDILLKNQDAKQGRFKIILVLVTLTISTAKPTWTSPRAFSVRPPFL